MRVDFLRALYIHDLSDLYSAELQLAEVLSEFAEAASSGDLRQTFKEHLKTRREHVLRLESVFSFLRERPTIRTCKAMRRILEGAEELSRPDGDPALNDANLISMARRAEQYEIAGYGSARMYAELLGEEDCAALLQKSLNDERAADQVLTGLAERLNHRAPAHA